MNLPELSMAGADAVAGLAHQRAGRMQDAQSCYQRSLAAYPAHPRILGLLGQVQMALGAFDAGLASLAQAVTLMPGHFETRFAYANACAVAGRHDDAIAEYQQLQARDPAHLGCALNLISLLRYRNENSLAREVALAALAHHPEQPGLMLGLAVLALEERAAGGALPLAERVLLYEPDCAEAHFLRGTALNMLGRHGEAVDAQYCAIALNPGHAPAHLNLANALVDLDRTAEALDYCRQAIAIDPRLTEAYVSLGYICTRLNRLDDAMAACGAALALSPGHVQAHWNLGIAALLAGDWYLGWRQYEWRKRPELYAAHFRVPHGEEWRGGDLRGRTLTICAEQGLGDAIQLARYWPALRARGAQLILSCARALMPLFAVCPDTAQVIDRESALPDADLWVDQMSLPGLLGATPCNVPGAEGYIHADAALVARWREMLPAGRKVGLIWGGNPLHSNDRRRSAPAAQMAELLNITDVSWVSLQVGRALPQEWAGRVFDAAPALHDFAQTAACIANLDLLISVDTSAVHLAGAMGAPVWVMLPFAPDWRWMLHRANTPWYNSMRLFRQGAENDWHSVVHDVAVALRGQIAELD